MESNLNEEWRKLPGFSRYSVSNLGNARRDVLIYRAKPALLSISRTPEDYAKVALVDDEGRYRTCLMHSLVAAAFLGKRQARQVVRHLNGYGGDNRLENLSYGSYQDNVADSILHGTQIRGSRQHLSVLTEMQVHELKLLRINQGLTMKRLAAMFEVNASTVFDILKGRTWAHVDPVGDIRWTREQS